eukprot:8612008-Pyramimonas_sp.AAC.1
MLVEGASGGTLGSIRWAWGFGGRGMQDGPVGRSILADPTLRVGNHTCATATWIEGGCFQNELGMDGGRLYGWRQAVTSELGATVCFVA